MNVNELTMFFLCLGEPVVNIVTEKGLLFFSISLLKLTEVQMKHVSLNIFTVEEIVPSAADINLVRRKGKGQISFC